MVMTLVVFEQSSISLGSHSPTALVDIRLPHGWAHMVCPVAELGVMTLALR